MADRITIDLPTPAHSVGKHDGTRWLHGYEIHDSDNQRHARIAFEGMEASLVDFERLALAMLWMVRGHPKGSGLTCEVPAELDESAEEHIVDALLSLGLWDEIDGDGSAASIIADHIRQIPRLLHPPPRPEAAVMPGGGHA
jgi:hypothetical protein